MDAKHGTTKRLTPEAAARRAAACRERGETVVFTNGCFDLLHAGHVGYLRAARAAGDVLLVGLNSDTSVRSIKGPGRPLNREEDRLEVLAALACVDGVIVFEAPDPLDLITALAPDVLVKGADWPEAEIIGAAAVKQRGGRVVRVALHPALSTSILIRRILKRYGGQPGGAP
jgi:rfaE bifunctional protein nucleotidyltransferase chain/domain